MNHLAPDSVGCRVNPSSTDDLDTADASVSLVANDVETRVGAGHSSSEDVNPNPLSRIGDPPSTSTGIDGEVAALKAQVGQLAEMFRAFMAQHSPATPPNLSAASASSEASSAQQRKSIDSLSPEMI